ncbi:MarR family winged helix-turn-helix transcriptional regulator [Nocardioides cheoyonin]|uniref:MarR family winged helix-turn-helix transcriptional regulator n=1 Tax=Nocardioides cheoyonin TaxID=3156615 RepID=UPI0032B3EBE8
MDGTGDLLMSAARALRRRFATTLAQWEITPAQGRALRIVSSAQEPPRLSEIAERLRIVPRSATEVVDALEQRGLVVRQPDPGDRRATCVVATAEGERLAGIIEEARSGAAREYLSVLPASDRRELARILEKLVAEG